MDPLLVVSALLIAAVLTLVLVVRYYQDRVGKLRADIEENGASRRRLAAAQARVQDNWAPVLARHPLQVLPDRVVFVEFTGGGRPGGDARVRDLVRSGRVEWLQVAIEPQTEPPPPEFTPVPQTRPQEGLS